MTAPKPKLRWFQYSLRSLMVFVTLCAILCSWLAVKMQQARREQEAAAAIEELGGAVGWSEPSGPVWLQSMLGDGFFTNVVQVYVQCDGTDVILEKVKEFPQLQILNVGSYMSERRITDTGLEHLRGMTQLQELSLECTEVTDAGVKKLQQALPNCTITRSCDVKPRAKR
jgi:uncharacterized membrane protein